MVSSSGGIVSIGSGLQSQVGEVSLVKNSIKKAEEFVNFAIPEAVIKYHKISKRDKHLVPEGLPKYYIEAITESERKKKEDVKKFLGRFQFIKINSSEAQTSYLKDCYMLDYIFSPIKYKGKGSSAMKKLVEKAVFDKKINGRIVVNVKTVENEMSACVFFYKLGFRFVEAEKNQILHNIISDSKNTTPPTVVGLMYLPKESLSRLLIYKMMV